jgi:hypothetical protein
MIKQLSRCFASGLSPKTAYGVHVHNQACANGFGGGHYQQNPADGVNNMNEIWPGFTTDEMGIGYGKATHQYRARPEAQSVVIHDTDGARIACADLAY